MCNVFLCGYLLICKMPDIRKDLSKACKELWKQMLAEFIGTLFLVLIGCGSTVGGKLLPEGTKNVPFLDIALCFGITVGVIIHIIGQVSGGQINPAVTVGLLVARKISIITGICIIFSQLVGAIAGAALLYATLPSSMLSNPAANLGVTKVSASVNYGQAFEIEFFITFLLVFCVFMVVDPKRPYLSHEPMAIGLVVAVSHIFAIKYTGSSMNPARSFGPALIAMDFEDHWVYWVGPVLGGVVAAVLYRCIYDESPLFGKKEATDEDKEIDNESQAP